METYCNNIFLKIYPFLGVNEFSRCICNYNLTSIVHCIRVGDSRLAPLPGTKLGLKWNYPLGLGKRADSSVNTVR